jgi:hypothetical protein
MASLVRLTYFFTISVFLLTPALRPFSVFLVLLLYTKKRIATTFWHFHHTNCALVSDNALPQLFIQI